jgi:hypothetical protein
MKKMRKAGINESWEEEVRRAELRLRNTQGRSVQSEFYEGEEDGSGRWRVKPEFQEWRMAKWCRNFRNEEWLHDDGISGTKNDYMMPEFQDWRMTAWCRNLKEWWVTTWCWNLMAKRWEIY